MDIILITLVLFLLDRYRRKATAREIAEALGSRDSLIKTLRNEIKDRYTVVDARAFAADSSAHNAETAARDARDRVEEMKLNMQSVDRIITKEQRRDIEANRASIDTFAQNENASRRDIDAELAGHRKVLDAHRRDINAQQKDLHALAAGQRDLHKITDRIKAIGNRLHEQCDTNSKVSQGLRRDVNHCLERLGGISKALKHPKPPLGDNPFPTPQPPHCYDGPNT